MHEENGRRAIMGARAIGARLVVGAVVALLALFLPVGAAVAQDGADVEAQDNEFVPERVEVTVGESVDWTHTGSNPHTITDEGGRFDEETSTGDTFSYSYDEPGTYPYYCKFHGAEGGTGMSGVVVVQAAQEEPSEEPSEQQPSEPAEEETTGGEASEPAEEETTDDGAADDTADDPADSGEGAGDDAASVTGSISASDQTGDGTTVQVDSVTISGSPGFVVVHLDQDGAPGPVLGHEAIPEGTSTGVQVTLDEQLDDSATLWPMLHTDQGTVGTYEFPGADVPVMADGEVVMVPISYEIGLAFTGPPTRADAPWVAALGVALVAAGAAVVWRVRPATARE